MVSETLLGSQNGPDGEGPSGPLRYPSPPYGHQSRVVLPLVERLRTREISISPLRPSHSRVWKKGSSQGELKNNRFLSNAL